ncbi:MAG: O-antigen ligase family protein [Flavobacteriales bacterium]|nr:O-antigen ligase family protein [Flavobacteriales bacterium]
MNGSSHLRDAKDAFRVNPWLMCLILAAFAGAAVSYSYLYAYHVIAVIYLWYARKHWVWVFRNGRGLLTQPLVLFPIISIVWYAAWTLFANDPALTLQYMVYISCGFFVVTVLIVESLRPKEDARRITTEGIFRTLACVAILEIAVGLLEIFTPFRWPVSRLSPILHWFGRTTDITNEVLLATDTNYLYSMPTGLHYNPNDFAAVMCLVFPFLWLMRNRTGALLWALTIVLLIVESGSRLAFFSLCFMAVSETLISLTRFSWHKLVLLGLLLFVASDGFFVTPTHHPKVEELAFLNPKDKMLSGGREESAGMRRDLFYAGIEMVKQDPLLGKGPGGARRALLAMRGVGKEHLVDLHFYWLELAVDMGLLYALLFALWYGFIAWSLWKLIKRSSLERKYVPQALFLALVGFGMAGVAPSSLVYFLPMYLAFGLSLWTIKTERV